MYAQDDHAKVVSDEPFPLFDENHLIVENLLHQGLLINLPVAPLCAYGWDGECPEATRRGISRPEPKPATGLEALSKFLEGDSR